MFICQDSVQASSHASHQQSKHAHAVVRRCGELHSTSFSALNLRLNERALQLLGKQECAARCLAGSWLIIAIGAESSLSASTLILINRSTATVPPCRSPEHSQPLLHRCSSISTISTAGEKRPNPAQNWSGSTSSSPSAALLGGPTVPSQAPRSVSPPSWDKDQKHPVHPSTPGPGFGCDVAPTIPKPPHLLCLGTDPRKEGFPSVFACFQKGGFRGKKKKQNQTR